MTLQDTHKKLRKRRLQNILLNFLCILIAGSGLIWVANYFWKYIHYEITNDAFIDQYVSPLNIRASGYIKEVRFKEHQYVHQGDTLLILDNREYQIKVKEAEAALLDVKGSKEVLHSGIETSQTNIAVQDANIARNFVEALRTLDMVPRQFVYISSLSIFGPIHEDNYAPISERDTAMSN